MTFPLLQDQCLAFSHLGRLGHQNVQMLTKIGVSGAPHCELLKVQNDIKNGKIKQESPRIIP
jgi:hypothetical protein